MKITDFELVLFRTITALLVEGRELHFLDFKCVFS